jgi:hypothetical protein
MRPTFLSISIAVALVTAFSPPDAHAQAIGVFTDPTATSCSFTIQSFSPISFYIVAALGPQACSGIQGAEFRVEGFPADWFSAPISDPPSPIAPAGNPFVEGAHLAYSACLTSESGLVLLMTMFVFPTSIVENRVLTVVAHSAPALPGFECPLVVLCDPPTYTAQCVRGLIATINHSYMWCCQDACAFPTCPPVAVEPTTWSSVKSLYATP